MLNQLLPPQLDNVYRGYKMALWLLALVLLQKIAMCLNILFNGAYVATTADGIPLGTFPAAAAQTVLAFFALWGLDHLMISLLCILVLVRYRSMVPLMYVLLVLEHLGRKLALVFLPVARVGTPPGFYINLGLLALMIIGLLLSFRRQPTEKATVTNDPLKGRT